MKDVMFGTKHVLPVTLMNTVTLWWLNTFRLPYTMIMYYRYSYKRSNTEVKQCRITGRSNQNKYKDKHLDGCQCIVKAERMQTISLLLELSLYFIQEG